MNTIILNNILSGKFMETIPLIKDFPLDELENLLLKIGYDYCQGISPYAFICMLLQQNECIEYHFIAESLLCGPLCCLDGAYETALYHNRRILDIDITNLRAKTMMLYFNTLAIPLIDDREAQNIANEILKNDPENVTALQFLENTEGGSVRDTGDR